MKKVFYVLSILFLSSIVYGEETSLQRNKFGLEFQIPSSLAASIAGKFHVEDLLALEMELGFGYQVEDKNDNQVEGGGLKLGVYVNKYLFEKRVAPYIKGGLAFAKNFGDLNENNDDVYITLLGGLGTSFFVTKEFAIGGEVLLAAPVSPAVKIGTSTTQLFATFYF